MSFLYEYFNTLFVFKDLQKKKDLQMWTECLRQDLDVAAASFNIYITQLWKLCVLVTLHIDKEHFEAVCSHTDDIMIRITRPCAILSVDRDSTGFLQNGKNSLTRTLCS